MAGMSNTSYRGFLGLLGWIFLVPSVLSALVAVWLIYTGAYVAGDVRSAEGRVVAHRAEQNKRSRWGNHSVVKFSLPDGRSVVFEDAVARRGGAEHAIGETVTVRYRSSDPQQAQISGSAWIQTLLGVGWLLFSTIGILVGWLMLRLRPKATPPVAA
ncbi:DUF3592 domain-containing protein [Rhodoferax sp. AJA081-3]|nr:DUF3592 domain-containing protein [Rhodoferax sp. AJA081-3]